MKELGGQTYFLIKKIFYYYKRRSNLNFRATKAIVYIYHKYFVVTLKLTNYAEDTSLISLSDSFFMIFRRNSCIEAKYCVTVSLEKNIPGIREVASNLTVFFVDVF